MGAIVSALFAGEMLVRHTTSGRESSVAGLILGCGSFGSVCQILWNTADDPQVAIYYIRLSSRPADDLPIGVSPRPECTAIPNRSGGSCCRGALAHESAVFARC